VKTRVIFAIVCSLAFAACSGTNASLPSSSAASDLPAASSSNPLKASVVSLSLTSRTTSAPLIVSERGYKGVFIETGCPAYVVLSPKQGNGPSQKFTAKMIKAGKCTLKISDAAKHSISIRVTATTTTGVIQ
jgi:hypothetical protein